MTMSVGVCAQYTPGVKGQLQLTMVNKADYPVPSRIFLLEVRIVQQLLWHHNHPWENHPLWNPLKYLLPVNLILKSCRGGGGQLAPRERTLF